MAMRSQPAVVLGVDSRREEGDGSSISTPAIPRDAATRRRTLDWVKEATEAAPARSCSIA